MFNDLEDLFRFDKTNIHLAGQVAARAYFEAEDFSTSTKDPSKQMKFLTKLMNITFQISVKFGSVYATSKVLEGVAAWLPHDKAKMTAWGILRSGAFRSAIRLGSKLASKMDSVFSVLDEDREENLQAPYFYLSVIGVGPEFQGQGFGGLLIKKLLQQADEAGYPIYLETETENNVLLYEKFGLSDTTVEK